MRRMSSVLMIAVLASSCGSQAAVSEPSPAAATTAVSSRSNATEFPKPTVTPVCVGVPNLYMRRIPGDQGFGQIYSNTDFIGVGAVDKMYAPTAFSLVIPGQTTWLEIVEETVLTGGISSVDDLHLATGTRVRVTVCHKNWDGARTIGDWQGFYRLGAIGPAS